MLFLSFLKNIYIYIYIYIYRYIVLNKSDYHSKLQTILNDKNKFIKLNSNPTNQLKSKINKLINSNNADVHNINLPKIIGNYKRGYIYRTWLSIPTNNFTGNNTYIQT